MSIGVPSGSRAGEPFDQNHPHPNPSLEAEGDKAGVQPSRPSVRGIMGWTLFALIPGALAQTLFFGAVVLLQISLAVGCAFAFEAVMLRLRRQPLRPFLTDLSAPLTAVLFALWLPPSAPWWFTALGMAVAIIGAKQLFGGLGSNLFNPAMAGYAALLLLFPQHFTAPSVHVGAVWIALAYTLGGAILLWRRVVRWPVPLAMLGAGLTLCLLWIWFGDAPTTPLQLASRWAPWLLAAFFIATDPVTGCSSPRGRLVFGAGVALLAFALQLRGWQAPGALAVAVLLMNVAAPWIDRHFEPRVWTRPA